MHNHFFKEENVEEIIGRDNGINYWAYLNIVSNKFCILKDKNILGSFNSSDDAVLVRDILIQNNWDINYFKDNPVLKINGKFIVFKVNDDKVEIFNKFDSFAEAIPFLTSDNKSSDNKYISDSNGAFYIQKSVAGVTQSWGRFESYDLAILARNLLIKNDWNVNYFKRNPIIPFYGKYATFKVINDKIREVGLYSSEEEAQKAYNEYKIKPSKIVNQSKYGHNIYLYEDKFNIKKTIRGKQINFGFFNTNEDALLVRNILMENNWSINFFRKNPILKRNGQYHSFRVIKKQIILMGSADSYDEANKLLNKSVEVSIPKSKSISNISVISDKFCVRKGKNGKEHILGRFDSKDIAIFVRNVLSNHSWSINYFRRIILENNGKFLVFNLINKEIQLLDEFDNVNDAKNNYDYSFIQLSDDEKIFKSAVPKSKYGKNIYRSSGKFVVEKQINRKHIVFGKFLDHDVAVLVRDALENNDWNIQYFVRNPILKSNGNEFLFEVSNNLISLVNNVDEDYQDSVKDDSDDSFIEIEYVVKKDGKLFGRFSSVNIAKVIRDNLSENNWDVNYFKQNPILEVKDKFYSLKVSQEIIEVVGEYDDYSLVSSALIDEFKQDNNEKSNDKPENKILNEEDFSKIPLNISKFKGKYVISQQNKIWARFDSKDIADIFMDLIKIHGITTKEYFVNNNIFSYKLNFYIFKLINNEVKFFKRFEFYSDAKIWAENYNRGLSFDDIISRNLIGDFN